MTNFYKFEEVYKNTDSSNLTEFVFANKFYGYPMFNYVNLTLDEQVNIRGKPLKYLLHTIDIFKSFTNHKIILEIGSIRGKMNHDIKDFNPLCCNDGHSTYFWKNYTNADIYTVDINEGCKNIIHNDVRLNGVNAITDDAINYAKIFDKKIDLLFLDAWDVTPSTPYAEKHLEIFNILKDKLSESCIILIDDTDIDNGGKGKLLIPQLKKEGFIQIFSGRQSLFFRGYIID